MSGQVSRGEIWLANLDPTQGREQAGTRPILIISVNGFNYGAAELVVGVPITSRAKGIPLHVEIIPPEGGLNMTSYAKCEDIRSVSINRIVRKFGKVSEQTIEKIEDRLKILLGL